MLSQGLGQRRLPDAAGVCLLQVGPERHGSTDRYGKRKENQAARGACSDADDNGKAIFPHGICSRGISYGGCGY